MRTLYLVALGHVDAPLMDAAERTVLDWFPFDVTRMQEIRIEQDWFRPARAQYESVPMMQTLAAALPAGGARILGLTTVDISIPMLSFLFGQAQFNGPVALVSAARLRQEFYGMPADEPLLLERLTKEVLHELGHTSGLIHCPAAECAMSLATHIGLVDTKQPAFCKACGSQLVRHLTALRG